MRNTRQPAIWRSHLIALEPRMMFDGAAVATTSAALADVSAGQAPGVDAHAADPGSHDPAASMDAGHPVSSQAPSGDASSAGHPASTGATYAASAGPDLAGDDVAARPQGHLRVQGFVTEADTDDRLAGHTGTAPDDRLAGGLVFDQASPQPAAAATASRDYIFIDTAIADYQKLVGDWQGQGTIVLIDAHEDGVAQMLRALEGQHDVTAIHIVSHGSYGAFNLGTTRIDGASLTGELGQAFATLGDALTADGDLLIYG